MFVIKTFDVSVLPFDVYSKTSTMFVIKTFDVNCNNSERENESSSNHGNIEYSPDHHSDDNSTSFSGSENSCHSVASR
jgi:hypothetical protein